MGIGCGCGGCFVIGGFELFKGFGFILVFKREGFELFLLLILSFEWVELDR